MTDACDITPLHVRSGYSCTRGTAMPRRLLDVAAAQGHRRLALTDVNNLCGAPAFCSLAARAGMRPIVGAELAEGGCSVVALIAAEEGYANLCRIITRVHSRSDAQPPGPPAGGTACAIDNGSQPRSLPGVKGAQPLGNCVSCPPTALLADLGELQEGLHVIVESPRTAALLAAEISPGRLWVALDAACQSVSQFRTMAQCAEELHLPTIATGKSLMASPGEYDAARLLAAIRTGTMYETVRAADLPHPRAVLRGPAALRREMRQTPQAAENNAAVVRQCAQWSLLPRRPVFPDFSPTGGLTAAAYLRRLCREGLVRRYGDRPAPASGQRLERELGLIERMGFCEYFLVVWDIVQHARLSGAPVAGRGSGASSIAAYVLGITNVCPLRYGIPFERFMHEGRDDFPDLDVDFCWRGRDEVIEYAFARWGGNRAAMVCTHNTFAEQGALRETAKAMGYSNDQISRLDDFQNVYENQ